jgi:hypothetical protein
MSGAEVGLSGTEGSRGAAPRLPPHGPAPPESEIEPLVPMASASDNEEASGATLAGTAGGGTGAGTTIGSGATIVTAAGLTLVSVTVWAPLPEPLVALKE